MAKYIKEMIIDYSKRTDPACLEGAKTLIERLNKLDFYPKIIHFWTKAPANIVKFYKTIIDELKDSGVIVCAQVTLNYYDRPLEMINERMRDLSSLVDLLGSEYIRLRFDPIIFGYTNLTHYKKTLETAIRHNIKRITVNFLEPRYKGVGTLLKKFNIKVEDGSLDRRIITLQKLRNETPDKIEIAVCAESSYLIKHVGGIELASCTDPKWFKSLGVDLTNFKGHYSRKGFN